MRSKGGVPLELTEADIAERFGWTFSQLDEEDQDRVFNAFALQNVRDAIDRIKQWLANFGKIRISQSDLMVYGMIQRAEAEEGMVIRPAPQATGIEQVLAEVEQDAKGR